MVERLPRCGDLLLAGQRRLRRRLQGRDPRDGGCGGGRRRRADAHVRIRCPSPPHGERRGTECRCGSSGAPHCQGRGRDREPLPRNPDQRAGAGRNPGRGRRRRYRAGHRGALEDPHARPRVGSIRLRSHRSGGRQCGEPARNAGRHAARTRRCAPDRFRGEDRRIQRGHHAHILLRARERPPCRNLRDRACGECARPPRGRAGRHGARFGHGRDRRAPFLALRGHDRAQDRPRPRARRARGTAGHGREPPRRWNPVSSSPSSQASTGRAMSASGSRTT